MYFKHSKFQNNSQDITEEKEDKKKKNVEQKNSNSNFL